MSLSISTPAYFDSAISITSLNDISESPNLDSTVSLSVVPILINFSYDIKPTTNSSLDTKTSYHTFGDIEHAPNSLHSETNISLNGSVSNVTEVQNELNNSNIQLSIKTSNVASQHTTQDAYGSSKYGDYVSTNVPYLENVTSTPNKHENNGSSSTSSDTVYPSQTAYDSSIERWTPMMGVTDQPKLDSKDSWKKKVKYQTAHPDFSTITNHISQSHGTINSSQLNSSEIVSSRQFLSKSQEPSEMEFSSRIDILANDTYFISISSSIAYDNSVNNTTTNSTDITELFNSTILNNVNEMATMGFTTTENLPRIPGGKPNCVLNGIPNHGSIKNSVTSMEKSVINNHRPIVYLDVVSIGKCNHERFPLVQKLFY